MANNYNFDNTKYPLPANNTAVGVHGGANGYHPLGDNSGNIPGILDEMKRCGFTWLKLVDMDGCSIIPAQMALAQNIMPVIRLLRSQPYPGTLQPKQITAARDLYNIGVRYFERGNEPNLEVEWQAGMWPGQDWNAWTNSTFDKLVADWYTDAKYIASLGGYVAIDANSPGGNYDDILFSTNWFKALQRLGSGPINLLKTKGWIAVHPAGLNHPPNYPDDTINQSAENHGETIDTHFHADGSPTGSSNCVRKWEAVGNLFYKTFGFIIPVMATEGGYWPGRKEDPRYPEIDINMNPAGWSASQLNIKVFKTMSNNPPWYMANMPWLWANRLFANPYPGFERDSWKRIPGFGDCPVSEPSVQPIINELFTAPVQKRTYASQPTQPTIVYPAVKINQAINEVPATAKAAIDRGYTFVNEVYASGDKYAFAICRYQGKNIVLTLDAGTWAVVAEKVWS